MTSEFKVESRIDDKYYFLLYMQTETIISRGKFVMPAYLYQYSL